MGVVNGLSMKCYNRVLLAECSTGQTSKIYYDENSNTCEEILGGGDCVQGTNRFETFEKCAKVCVI